MSLTKNDLSQIKKIIHSEITIELKPINRKLDKISEDINMVIDHFDRDYLEMRARIDRIEKFLKIPPLTA